MPTLSTSPLEFIGKQNQKICDGLFLNAKPATTTAIMGLAGCGKSVFLRILAGYLGPTRGRVFLNEEDLHLNYRKISHRIGYVPQAEIMIPELTVLTSLDYRIRFNQAGIPALKRRRMCEEVCELLAFDKPIDVLLRQQIGMPEWSGGYPSGGERRRINIAHELLASPHVLLMDEPTSGLSSGEADLLIRQMSIIARSRDIPVIMTIHQPSKETFERFDDLLVIARGGRMVYYGPAKQAIHYFSANASRFSWDGKQNPADYMLKVISIPENGNFMVKKLQENLGNTDFPYLIKPGVPQ